MSKEISQYGTSWQALDLLLAERTVDQILNPKLIAEGRGANRAHTAFRKSVDTTPGLVDLANPRSAKPLGHLTPVQNRCLKV